MDGSDKIHVHGTGTGTGENKGKEKEMCWKQHLFECGGKSCVTLLDTVMHVSSFPCLLHRREPPMA